MACLSICLLGPFRAVLNGKVATGFESDKARALLIYLAAEPGRPHRRETLAGLFWPEHSEESARANLRRCLVNLRQVLGDQAADPPLLLITRQTIQLNPAADIWVDVVAFAQLTQAGQLGQQALERMQEGVALYQGELLEGFSLPDSAPFEEWALLKREQLRRRALSSLRLLIVQHESQGNYEQAVHYAWQRVELDPLSETAQRQLMCLLVLTGQRAAALAQYEECRRILSGELGIEPASETVRLYERIRDGRMAEASQEEGRPAQQPSRNEGIRPAGEPALIPVPQAASLPRGHESSPPPSRQWPRPVAALLPVVALLLLLTIQASSLSKALTGVDSPPDRRAAAYLGGGWNVSACEQMSPPEICLFDRSTNESTQLTHQQLFEVIQGLSWSPDRQQIVIAAKTANTPEMALHLLNADGSDLRILGGKPFAGSSPVWSPDGRWIALNRDNALWAIRPDGSAAHVIAEVSMEPVPLTEAGWSPDSQRLAFMQVLNRGEGWSSEVWTVQLDGSLPRLVRSFPGRAYGALAWSPTGQQIFCVCLFEEELAPRKENFFLFNVDGTGEVQRLDGPPISWFATYWPQWGQ